MVVNTELCSFSEVKIWPGRGSRFVAKDSKIYIFLSHKVRSLHHQRVKPVKLTWTQTWRRFNKKGKTEQLKKKRIRRTYNVQKAIVGASLDDIKKRREEKPEVRAAMREQALREIKERQKKTTAASKKFEKRAQPGAKQQKVRTSKKNK